MNDLNKLRKSMREKRKALTNDFRADVAQKIAAQFKMIKPLQDYNNIAVYSAFDGEVDLKNIIDFCWTENKKVFLPKLNSADKTLIFCEYFSDSLLTENQFGIAEPENNNSVKVEALDMVLIPLTAFDKKGHRLGMGQGYYDHTLRGVVRHPPFHTPVYIGVGYAFQEVEALASHPQDVPLDGVLTENGFKLTKS